MKKEKKYQEPQNEHIKTLKAKTKGQYLLFKEIQDENKKIILVSGKPGTGKTFAAAYYAIKGLMEGKFNKIFLTRPAVEACGENFGFLKGGLEEKIYPYLLPIYEEIEKFITQQTLLRLKQEKKINVAPLAFMRGRNLENAFVILDEAQNVSMEQFKMILTRLHDNSKIVVCGDFDQSDLKHRNSEVDFKIICRKLRNMDCVSYVELGDEDIIRSKFISEILDRLKQE